VITLITLVGGVGRDNQAIYEEFVLKSTEDCRDKIEYMPLYNVTHPTKALNQAIEKAKHNLIIICHQDVKLPDNFVACLESCLAKLPKWGLCGLAGVDFQGGNPFVNGKKIAKVMTIDSLCVILDRRNPLRFDEGFKWWHCYAEDLALQANFMGPGTYALPCKWIHQNVGPDQWNLMQDFGGREEADQRLREKWLRKVREAGFRKIFMTIGTIP